RPRRLEVHLTGDVQPFHRDDAAEVGGVAREANEHPALVGRLNASREISGHPAEEELLLRVVVARPAEREQRVVPRIAVDSALDGAGDRGIGHGIGRAGRRDKTERHRDEQRESEGTTGGEPPGTHGLIRVVRVGGTSQRREPDAYARARHDGASFSGKPASVGPASTCRHPHTNLAAIAGPLDERRQHRTVNGAGTITWASPNNSRLGADSVVVRGGRDRVQTELHEGDRDAGVIRIPREVRPRGRHIAHSGGRDYASPRSGAPLFVRAKSRRRAMDGRTRAGLRKCPMRAHTLAVGSRTDLPSKTISRTTTPEGLMRRSVVCLLVTGVLVAISAPLAGGQTSGLWAEIRRTEYGIPHILANDWQSLGFGTGYAFAQDNICTIAETYVTVDGERSRFFGPDGSYVQEALGIRVNNLDSDLFFRQIIDSHVIDRMLAEPPPLGPEPAVLQDVHGYAEGYNRYLSDVGGSSGVPDPRCQGQPWVRSITVDDVYRRLYQLILLAGYDVVIPGIAEASPPPPGGTTAAFDPQSAAGAIAANWSKVRARLGSNAVAVGSAGTSNGAGLLLGNPHFPWHGPERFYQMQLTIPGQVNVTGVGLY